MEKHTFTQEEINFCEATLSNWKVLIECIGKAEITLIDIRKLIMYEATTRQRKVILDRLLGRYFKLCRKREWERLMQFIDERKQSRSVLN